MQMEKNSKEWRIWRSIYKSNLITRKNFYQSSIKNISHFSTLGSIGMQKFEEKINRLVKIFSDQSHQDHLRYEYYPSVIQNDPATMEIIIQAAKSVLSNCDYAASTQLKASRFIKECTDSWNPFFLKRLKEEIFPILASAIRKNFLNPHQEDNLDKEIEEIVASKELFRLQNECLFIWSKWLTGDKIAFSIWSELLKEGLTLPKDLTFFCQTDILYRDVEMLGYQHRQFKIDSFIYSENQLFFEQFLCIKQGKFLSNKLVVRTVSFIGDQLYQVEVEKGIQMKKIISFPEYFFLQERAEYMQIKGFKVPKINGIDLKMEWEDSSISDLDWRLICRRGKENRCFAIYFASKQQAIKLKDYIHFIKAQKTIQKLKEKLIYLAKQYKSSVAANYVNKRVFIGEESTQGSSQVDDFLDNAQVDQKIDQFLQLRNL